MADKADIWMPLYIGDYLADTAHLDATRSGAYLHLLMHYWRKGALVDDAAMLCETAKLRGTDATSILQALLGEFFTKNGDGRWHQKRQDIEREKWQGKKLKAHEKAKAAAEARWGTSDATSNAPSTRQALLEQCPLPLPSPLPLTVPQPKTLPKAPPSSQIATLYGLYPRHEGKGAAEKAIAKALKAQPFDSLLLAVQAYCRKVSAEGTEPQFIPLPATWFNQSRWQDDMTPHPKTAMRESEDKYDRLFRELEERRNGN